MPPSFDGDHFYVASFSNGMAYSGSMDGMDKMCYGHLWCSTKTINIQKNLDSHFDILLVLVISSA